MKYLKKYKIFESDEFATTDELDTIEEILLDIKDLDLFVDVNKNIGGENEELESESEIARIYIENYDSNGDPVEYYPNKDFIFTLQHLVSYVIGIGYNIEIESIHNSSIIDRVSSEDGVVNDTDILVFEYKSAPISYIKIIITYKD